MPKYPAIFVSIACFMDEDVINTVDDLFSKAANPNRVYAGICLQEDPDQDVFAALERYPHVRLDRLPYFEARGPIYARSRCEALLFDEDYFFQIDSHTRFFPDWDELLIEEFKRCLDLTEQPVISHYPININNMADSEQLALIGHINRFRQVDQEDIKMHGTLLPLPPAPMPAHGISAAMLFMDAGARRRMPLDPNLHFGLHSAEQFLYSARLWTHGFDFMTPTRHSIATEYMTTRDRLPLPVRQHNNRAAAGWRERTWTKVKYLLELDDFRQVDVSYQDDLKNYPASYGMGQARVLTDYYRFIGLHARLLEYFPHYAARHADANR